MTRPVSVGFLTLPPSVFGEPRWRVTPNGMDTLTDPSSVPSWQYTTDLLVERMITCDPQQLKVQSGLASVDELRAILTWASTSTGLQGASKAVSLQAGGNSLSVGIPGVEAGGTLRLRLVVAAGLAACGQREKLAAYRSGAILHSDEWIVHLEGEASRFPTEALSFSATGLGDSSVAWRLTVATTDLDASALSAVRLVLNTDNEVHQRLIDRPDSDEAEVTRRFMSYDIARQLVVAALAQDELMPIDYESSSIGHVLRSRLRGYFGDEGDAIEPLRARWLAEPSEIDAELQRYFQL